MCGLLKVMRGSSLASEFLMIEVIQDFLDDGGLGDEREDFHGAATLATGQGVDLEDSVEELGPALAQSAPGRRGVGGLLERSRRLRAVVGAYTIGVGAIEMNQMLVGLWDVDEHAGEKLEGVGQGLIVELVPGFGLVEDELGIGMIAKPGEVEGRAHQIARELVEPFGIGGADRGAIVDGKTRVSPREEEVDALLGNEVSVS